MGRDPKHNYKSRCIYHVTIGKAPSCPDFSMISGSISCPIVERTPIGKIVESQILNFPELSQSLQILQYVIMPDHLHFAIMVKEPIPRALGCYIGMMKIKCLQIIRTDFPYITEVFTKDFHDRYLRPTHKLSTIIEYIQQNPRRLLARRMNPDFFRKINNIRIQGVLWQAYGNIQLLDNPFKAPVIIHRSDSPELRMNKYRRWKHLAENGGVLVSPFISPEEKEIRRQCEESNGRIILLSNKPFEKREKPAVHDFELCSQGYLLILAPMEPLLPGRDTFLYLNSIAEAISVQNDNLNSPDLNSTEFLSMI